MQAFAQLTYCESLRDIEACLHAQKNKLDHMGIRASISRNTLANANKEKRLKIEASLYTSLQVLSVTIFERMPLLQALTKEDYKTKVEPKSNQLLLFD